MIAKESWSRFSNSPHASARMQTDPAPDIEQLQEVVKTALSSLSKGELDDARSKLKWALQQNKSDSHLEGQCLSALSKIYCEVGDIDEAIRCSLKLLAVKKQSHGDDSDQAIAAMRQLAQLYEAAGRFDEAGDLQFRAQAMADRLVYSAAQPEAEVGAAQDDGHGFVSSVAPVPEHEYHEDAESEEPKPQQPVDVYKREKGLPEFRPEEETEQTYRTAPAPRENETASAQTPHDGAHKPSRKESENKNHVPPAAPAEENVPIADLFGRYRTEKNEQRIAELKAGPKPRSESEPAAPQFRANAEHPRSAGPIPQVHVPKRDTESNVRMHTLKAEGLARPSVNLIQQLQKASRSFNVLWPSKRAGEDHPQNKKALMMVLAVVLLLGTIISITIALNAPRKEQPTDVWLGTLPHKIRSMDGRKLINLSAVDHASVTINKSRFELPSGLFLGDWRDYLDIITHSFYANQLALFFEKPNFEDEEGTWLFPINGSRAELVTYMEELEDAAGKYYVQTQKYPGDVKQLGRFTGTEYENPYAKSDELEKPTVQSLTLPTVQSMDAASRKLLDILDSLQEGRSWPQETALTPGAINCLSLTVPYSKGKLQAFIVQGAGPDGKPLPGGHPDTYHYLCQQDGGLARAGEPYNLFDGRSIFNRRLIVVVAPLSTARLNLLRRTPIFLFLALALLIGLSFMVRLKREHNVLRVALIVVCLAGAGWYASVITTLW